MALCRHCGEKCFWEKHTLCDECEKILLAITAAKPSVVESIIREVHMDWLITYKTTGRQGR